MGAGRGHPEAHPRVDGRADYAELDQDDPLRETAATASYLRTSLFTSIVAFGVALLAAGTGVIAILYGWSLLALGRRRPEE